MTGWRVWFAFEVKPGLTSARDLSTHWRGLVDACRVPDGAVDATELERWTDLLLDHTHVHGDA